jgi:hypothetical protein
MADGSTKQSSISLTGGSPARTAIPTTAPSRSRTRMRHATTCSGVKVSSARQASMKDWS